MLRSDGWLLGYLATDLHPEYRETIRAEVARAAPSLAAAGQALIRAKVLSPQEFLACRTVLEASRRHCGRCRRRFVAFAGPRPKARRCPCGQLNRIPARHGTEPANPFSTRPDRSSRLDRHRSAKSTASIDGIPLSETLDVDRAGGGAPADVPRQIGGYPILGRVGEGGMGDIFRVRDRAGRVVALKLLRGGTSRDAEERFRREAEALARLRHPAIVQVHDVGVDRQGRPFFTMDYVEGNELTELSGSLERDELLELVAQVADGLHYAHEQGVIHRDVKPQNILVGRDGRPKLADFGLARVSDRSTLSADGELIGTPLFMAPEQVRGDPTAIGRGTDVYALGVLLYEALTGELPIEASSFFDLKEKVSTVVPEPPSTHAPDLPPALDAIILKALEKRAEDRYPTAAALAADLRRVVAGEDVAVRPVSALARSARAAAAAARSPWAAVALFVVLAGVALGVWSHAATRRQELSDAARQALLERQQRCRSRLGQALEGLLSARRAVAGGDVPGAREALQRAERQAAAATALAQALGEDAPRGFADDAASFQLGARRVAAACLAGGNASERAAAQKEYAALVAEAERTPDAGDLLALARLRLEAGAADAAISYLNDAIAISNAAPEAYLVRAEAHCVAGRPHFALLDFGRVLEHAPSDQARVRALSGRALAQLAAGTVERAEADLADAERLGVPDPRLWEARGAVRTAKGELGLAVRELDLALREFPGDPALRRAAGEAWARVGNLDRALADLDRAVDLTRDPTPRLVRARLRDLSGDAAGADADLAALAQQTGLPETTARRVALVVARIRRARGEGARAAAALTDLLRRLEGPGQDFASREAALLERAEAGLQAGDPAGLDAADRDFSTLLETNPTHTRALIGLATVATRRGDVALARARLRRLSPDGAHDPRALTLLAQFESGAGPTGAPRAALAAQRARVEAFVGPPVDPGDPASDAICALVFGRRQLDRAGDDPAAVQAAGALLERAVRLAPWLLAARLALAKALEAAQRSSDALDVLSEAEGIVGWEPSTSALRGRLLAETGNPSSAAEAYTEALRAVGDADPASLAPIRRGEVARLFLARAQAYAALDRSDLARDDLGRAIQLDGLLLEAFELRAKLLAGVDDGAAATDRERCELLRTGFVAIYEQARRDAWLQGFQKGGNHTVGIRLLSPAFDVVSRERSPARRADIHYLRAYMRMRALFIPAALIDLAAVIELGPRSSFRGVVDEFLVLRGSGSSLGVDLDSILEQAEAMRDEQADVDPDFLAGFLAFVELEVRNAPSERRLRAGLEGLARFLARRPGHTGALVIHAALLLSDGQLPEALGALTGALQAPDPPGFAYYVRARIQLAQRDPDGAFRSLAQALAQGFNVHARYASDPVLSRVRTDPRYEQLIGVAKGAAYLRQIDRAEGLARARPDARAQIYELARRAATTGLSLIRPWIKAGERDALDTAARLFLARARQAYRLNERRAARRDLCAALEASPVILGDWRHLAEVADALGPLDGPQFAGLEAAPGETLPTGRLAPALATVLQAATGGDVPPGDRASAVELLTARARDDASPGARILLEVLRGGDPAGLGVDPDGSLGAVLGWLTARRAAQQGDVDEAIRHLRRARRLGLRGPLGRDPALASLRDDVRFRALFPDTRPPETLRWREGR